jgi:hypothetical protein
MGTYRQLLGALSEKGRALFQEERYSALSNV